MSNQAKSKNAAVGSLVSELLLYHSVLGRGYCSPLPPARGMVFSSALHKDAVRNLAAAESQFRNWHEGQVKSDREALAQMEESEKGIPPNSRSETGRNIKELRERLSRIPNLTWKEGQVTKSTLIELLKRSFYGSITYLDPLGARLASALSGSPSRLADDLSWFSLMEGSTDETLIRASATGGSCIHSLSGDDAIFSYFCACHPETTKKLLDRISSTSAGRVITGHAVVIPHRNVDYSETSPEVLYSLIKRIYVNGADPEDKRCQVKFDASCAHAWQDFLGWRLNDITDRKEEFSEWELEQLSQAPASPETCIAFGARAAMTLAFVELASSSTYGPIREVVLTASHLEKAMLFARFLYASTSGIERIQRRLDNLKAGPTAHLSEDRIHKGRQALFEAIDRSAGGWVSRRQVRHIKGLTLGVLDELVNRGEVSEVGGNAKPGMVNVSRAYVMPHDAPPLDPGEASDEYAEAQERYQESKKSISSQDAYSVYHSLQRKAEAINAEHFLPVVPLSRMTTTEIRALPRVIETFEGSVLLRGVGADIPEAKALLEGFDDDDENILDETGMNLWIRYTPDGRPFRTDWSVARKLELYDHWCDEDGSNEQENYDHAEMQ